MDRDQLRMAKLAKRSKKSIEGEALDELGLHKYCCRRMILGNVHLISSI